MGSASGFATWQICSLGKITFLNFQPLVCPVGHLPSKVEIIKPVGDNESDGNKGVTVLGDKL